MHAKLWIGLGALAGLGAVAMAALAAHGLRHQRRCARRRDAAQRHPDAGLARAGPAGLRPVDSRAGRLAAANAAGAAFTAGLLLFCGAVYALALAGIHLPMVAPIGGTLLMLGWVLLAASTLRAR